MKKVILILEDEKVRFDWIKSTFSDIATIIWTKTVKEFFEKLEEIPTKEIQLLILDHDLGIDTTDDNNHHQIILNSSFPKDVNGNVGMDAVDMISSEFFNMIPAIVWSINTPRASEMVHRLQEKSFFAVHIPFSKKTELAIAVRELL